MKNRGVLWGPARSGETPPAGKDTMTPDAIQAEAEDVELVRDWANPFSDTYLEDHADAMQALAEGKR